MMPYRGRRPEVGWSAHMAGGWRAQLDCVRRWYHRASRAQDPTDRYDFLSAFFQNAFHLRDWLKDTGAASEEDLDRFFTVNADMRLCRDVANSHKHYSLRNPSQPAPPSEAYEYSPGSGNLGSDLSLVILSDGTKHDAFDLAGRILCAWEDFIASHVASERDAA